QVHRTTQTILNIEEKLLKGKFINTDETIIITGGIPIAARSAANFVKLHKCDGSMKELIKIQEEQFKEDLGPALIS
ncbi:MAG: hypothetical protein LW817_05425, partial [Candidatus Caenarcaniphilales bacterium]|nr:hypothetical protein [Candidatus Caenarcaniphilales bacterium]